jgi:hypothetical protein
MEYIPLSAPNLAERMAANLPTCYIDVRPRMATLTFSIIDPSKKNTECGAIRMSIQEVSDRLESLKKWANSREEYLIVVGCVTVHAYSQGVAQMLDFLGKNDLKAVSIHGNHYAVLNAFRGNRLPKLDI